MSSSIFSFLCPTEATKPGEAPRCYGQLQSHGTRSICNLLQTAINSSSKRNLNSGENPNLEFSSHVSSEKSRTLKLKTEKCSDSISYSELIRRRCSIPPGFQCRVHISLSRNIEKKYVHQSRIPFSGDVTGQPVFLRYSCLAVFLCNSPRAEVQMERPRRTTLTQRSCS